MEIFGAISSGEHWRSNDLNMIYSSDHDHHDQHDYHQFITSGCDVPTYDLNHIGTSTLEIPFTMWPSCESTIVHDIPSANYDGSEDQSSDMYLNMGCDDSHDWMNVNGHSQARRINAELKIEIARQTSVELKALQGNSKKRARSTMVNDDQDTKSRRNVKAKKITQKIVSSDDEECVNAGVVRGPISPNSPLSPGELSNASQEELGGSTSTSSPKEVVLNLNGKARASRGSATDPQSVYARKRREKINERLRTLQTLVPNGTKVDISTMLEEAVQYVKFLQLQIKLLSSDDMWMYAPLAYNGMDLGDLGFNSPRL